MVVTFIRKIFTIDGHIFVGSFSSQNDGIIWSGIMNRFFDGFLAIGFKVDMDTIVLDALLDFVCDFLDLQSLDRH